MNEEFVKRIYETNIKESIDIYKNLFHTTVVNHKTIDEWKNAMSLYEILTAEQKEIFFDILKMVMTDTVSGIFGVIDGSSTLNGGNMEIKMMIDGQDTEEELQDAFLEYVESLEE